MNKSGRGNSLSKGVLADVLPSESDLILDVSALLPGDVLLSRPRSPNPIEQKILDATGSPYSHAAIYIGAGVVADSNFPLGVAKASISSRMEGRLCVAVMRSQCGFSKDRQAKLNAFVDQVTGAKKFYDLISIIKFQSHRDEYLHKQIELIEAAYNKLNPQDDLAGRNFFCSAFVVACYAVVGIIEGPPAQALFDQNSFAPGHLGAEPTFGWLLGYLVPVGGAVPQSDPILSGATLWRDH